MNDERQNLSFKLIIASKKHCWQHCWCNKKRKDADTTGIN